VDDAELQPESELVDATYSVAELLDAQSRLLAKAKGFPGNIAVGVNFSTNGLNVKVKDEGALRAHLKRAGFEDAIPLTFMVGDPQLVDQSRVVGGRDATSVRLALSWQITPGSGESALPSIAATGLELRCTTG